MSLRRRILTSSSGATTKILSGPHFFRFARRAKTRKPVLSSSVSSPKASTSSNESRGTGSAL